MKCSCYISHLVVNMKTINFKGNAEGRDIPKGTVDAVVSVTGFVAM